LAIDAPLEISKAVREQYGQANAYVEETKRRFDFPQVSWNEWNYQQETQSTNEDFQVQPEWLADEAPSFLYSDD